MVTVLSCASNEKVFLNTYKTLGYYGCMKFLQEHAQALGGPDFQRFSKFLPLENVGKEYRGEFKVLPIPMVLRFRYLTFSA